MSEPFVISSLQNPRVKQVVRLRDRRDRDRDGLMTIEGYRELLRAQENGYPVEEVLFCPEMFRGENEFPLLEMLRASGARITQVAAHVFRKMAYRDRPEGVLGIAPQIRSGINDLRVGAWPFLVVAEAIEKPGNLGTILRSADATGVDGLVLCDRCTDLFNPNVVRASTGMLFSVPIAEASSAEALAWLRERGIAVLAATPHAEQLYTDVDMTQPLAVVVGAEQYGLSDVWMREADIQVRIPMLGQADSLNVATATTLLLYEVVRQRSRAGESRARGQ